MNDDDQIDALEGVDMPSFGIPLDQFSSELRIACNRRYRYSYQRPMRSKCFDAGNAAWREHNAGAIQPVVDEKSLIDPDPSGRSDDSAFVEQVIPSVNTNPTFHSSTQVEEIYGHPSLNQFSGGNYESPRWECVSGFMRLMNPNQIDPSLVFAAEAQPCHEADDGNPVSPMEGADDNGPSLLPLAGIGILFLL